MLTENKLDEIGAGLEYSPRKSLRCLLQDTSVTELMTLKLFKETVVHELQPFDPTYRVNFYDCS